MGVGYRIATLAVLALLGLTWFASVYGWGLRSAADAQALRRRRDVRAGSGGVYRGYYGGGPRYGK
jgi:hypothetical protein